MSKVAACPRYKGRPSRAIPVSHSQEKRFCLSLVLVLTVGGFTATALCQAPAQTQRTPPGRNEVARPLLLQGTVVMADDQPLPSAVRVAFVCRGVVQREMWMKGKGQFSFTLGGISEVEVMSAGISNTNDTNLGRSGLASRSRVDLSGCSLYAIVSGYVSNRIDLGVRRVLESPDVGTLTLTRSAEVKATSISVNSLAAPAKARKAFEKAVRELSREKANLSKATKDLDQAIQIYPEFAEAWHVLGRIRLNNQDIAGAREAFQKAVASDPAYLTPHLSIAELEVQLERWVEAVEASRRVLDLNPETLQAHYFQGLSYYNLGQTQLAEAPIRKVAESELGPNYPGVYYMLGAIEAYKGGIEAAAGHFRRFLQLRPEGAAADQLKLQLREWQEQGLIPPEEQN